MKKSKKTVQDLVDFFLLGAEEKYVADLATKILKFYREVLPLVKDDITLSFKYRDQADEYLDKCFVSVIIMEPKFILRSGETAFELVIGKGETVVEALECIWEGVPKCETS